MELTSSNTKTGVEVIDDGKNGSIQSKGNPVGRDEACQRYEDDKGGVQPVDMLVPVGPGHRRISDMNLSSFLLLAAQRHVVGSAIREGLGLDSRR